MVVTKDKWFHFHAATRWGFKKYYQTRVRTARQQGEICVKFSFFFCFHTALLTFSSLISEDFQVFLSSLFSAIALSGKCAENTAIARTKGETLKSSLLSKEKVNKAFLA